MPPKAGKGGNVISLHELPRWASDGCAASDRGASKKPAPVNLPGELRKYPYLGPPRGFRPSLNACISVVKADITRLGVDAIVNAAAVSLGSGGGGIDGAIRRAAGPGLSAELRGKHCERGKVVVSGGHSLPSKHVFHTVAPHGSDKDGDDTMRSCYGNCLGELDTLRLTSIAFCSLGAGIFKFDMTRGAHIALSTVRDYLERREAEREQEGGDGLTDRLVVLCCFCDASHYIYTQLARHYFPLEEPGADAAGPGEGAAAKPEAGSDGDSAGHGEGALAGPEEAPSPAVEPEGGPTSDPAGGARVAAAPT